MTVTGLSTAAVVLAAGGSARLGAPKQLLPWRGTTLLRHAVTAALEAGAAPVVVVLGAEPARVGTELAGLAVEVVENANWREGLASSIRTGLLALRALAPATSAALLVPCDQPLVTARHLQALISIGAVAAAPLVASAYAGVLGPPALFPQRLFAELLALTGDRGARAILTAHADEVMAVDFPGGELDVDSPADVVRLAALASSTISR